MRTWDPDVEVDCPIAHGIVTSQFPTFAELEPSFLGRGWDNYCIEYPDGTVFRLPTRQEGADILLNEIAALPALAGKLPLPIPVLRYFGVPANKYPYRFVGYHMLPGVTADQLVWSAEQRKFAAPLLGAFLNALHRTDLNDFEYLPGDHTGKADLARLMSRIRNRYRQVLEIDPNRRTALDGALAICEEWERRPVGPPRTCLVHGDLYPRHILANDRHQITGVIDWGDVHLGDPSIDLSVTFSFLGPDERDDFWAAYGRAPSAEEMPVMVLRAAMYGFALLAYGLEESDVAAANMGEQILGGVAG